MPDNKKPENQKPENGTEQMVVMPASTYSAVMDVLGRLEYRVIAPLINTLNQTVRPVDGE